MKATYLGKVVLAALSGFAWGSVVSVRGFLVT